MITTIISIILGSLWAYSFSTRINLLFVVPLGVKAIVMLGLAVNFSLIAYYLVRKFVIYFHQWKKAVVLLSLSMMIAGTVFVLVPYRHVPFRTVHELKINANESTLEIFAIYSPDDNLIERNSFSPQGDVEVFSDTGFRLLPGGEILYTRNQTGGLTLSFIAKPGTVTLTWDGTTHVFDFESIASGRTDTKNGWSAFINPETDRIKIELPGNTWGNPDPFWLLLGILLPIADYVTLVSLIIFMIWFVVFIPQKKINFQTNKKLVDIWLEVMTSILTSSILIHVGFPDFIPFWFLLFFIPTIIYLAYHQVKFLNRINYLNIQSFERFKTTIQQIVRFFYNINRSPLTFWILISIIAVLGSAIQIHLTDSGVGLSGDSVHYMDGARNLAAGSGYVRHIAEGEPVVMTGFPPVYPALLVPSFWLGFEVQQYARFLNTLLFALTIILTGWILYKATNKVIPAILVIFFLLMSPAILRIYSWVMSEPLFIVLLLVTVLLWYRHIKQPKTWKVILVGLVCGVMINTRLAGVAFIPPFAVGILIFQKNRFKQRLRDAFLLSVVSLLQPVAFFIRNSLITDAISESRGLTFASFPLEYWEIIWREVTSWFKWDAFYNFQYQQYNAMFISLGIIIGLTLGWIIFRKKFTIKRADSMMLLLLFSIPIYLSLIVFNTILLTPNQTVSGLTRYMVPIVLILFILLGKILNEYWEIPLLLPKLLILFLVLIASLLYFEDFSQLYEKQPFGFREYTDRKNLCGDDLISVIETIEKTGTSSFYTNNCEYFFHLTGHLCQHLPLEETPYQTNGEVYSAVTSGKLVAYVNEFGTNPPGIELFLADLDQFESACFFDFYRWPNSDE